MSENTASVIPTLTLNNGVAIPQLGFGTFQIPPEGAQRAVEEALGLGYRLIDTAAAYFNEQGVGRGIAASGLDRDQVFVTTKLANYDHGYNQALSAFDRSREALGLDVLDLYLIHWPLPARGDYVETWKALEKLLEDGKVRAIGVSNFLPEHLTTLKREADVVPAVNQIEVHPSFSQPETQKASRDLGIAVEAYSPLGRGADLRSAAVVQIAERLGVAPAQVVLRWHLQEGRIAIPKSTHAERIAANLRVSGFELTREDLAAIDALHAPAGRLGGDPATFAWSQRPGEVRS